MHFSASGPTPRASSGKFAKVSVDRSDASKQARDQVDTGIVQGTFQQSALRELKIDVRRLLHSEQELRVLVVSCLMVAAAACGVADPFAAHRLREVAAALVKISAHVHVVELIDDIWLKFPPCQSCLPFFFSFRALIISSYGEDF